MITGIDYFDLIQFALGSTRLFLNVMLCVFSVLVSRELKDNRSQEELGC